VGAGVWTPSAAAQAALRQCWLHCLSTRHWPGLLDRWWELCERVWGVPTIYEREGDGPASQADQDALNALLMSEVPQGSVHLLDPDLAPAADALAAGVEVVDERLLRCTFRGKRTLLLHNAGKAKPWVKRHWPYVRRTAYVRLLRRLLTADDLPIQLHDRSLAPWLRRGPLGAAAMLGLNALMSVAWRLAKLPAVRPFARRVIEALS
jgi:hypothetical protein